MSDKPSSTNNSGDRNRKAPDLTSSAWELGKDLFGKHGSGLGDLSRRRKKLVSEKIRARRQRR
jgi:hypothetical protein